MLYRHSSLLLIVNQEDQVNDIFRETAVDYRYEDEDAMW